MNSFEKQLTQEKKMVKLNPTDTMEEILAKAVQVRPSQEQIKWQELEFIAFIHFGINTFTDCEWGEGTESLDLFNPRELDVEQWIKAIKDAEMKAVILTCKHHSGFCLWPSQYTDYTIQNTIWQNGEGDIVRDVAKACEKYGIKFAIYLSPWDRHEISYGDSVAYNTYYKNQLTELLTNYGEVVDVWLDGACGEGPNGKQQEYDWRGYYETVKKIQPHTTITGMGADARWCGNEAGSCRQSEWSPIPIPGMDGIEADQSNATAQAFCNHNYELTNIEDLGGREVLQKHAKNGDWMTWYPSQVDISIRPGWFYHKREDQMVKSLKQIIDIYYQSVGGNSQLLLNVPPAPNGLLHPTDVTRLRQVGEVIRATFKKDLMEEATIMTSSENGKVVIDITFKQLARFNTLMIQEDIEKGQRVESFYVEMKEKGAWHTISSGTVIGYKKLIRLSEDGVITADNLRITVDQSRAEVCIKKIGLYKAPIIVAEPSITRSKEGVVSITSRIQSEIHYTIDGTTPTKESLQYIEPFELLYGGTVQAVAYYTVKDEDYYIEENTAASKTFGVNKKNWKVIKSHGNEMSGYEKESILSEDPLQYTKTSSLPYSMDIDMGEKLAVKGFSFMPVVEGYDFNYNVSKYSLYTSLDGTEWKEQKKEVSFDNIYHNPILQVVHFSEMNEARYIRFEAIETIQGTECAVMGEISVILV